MNKPTLDTVVKRIFELEAAQKRRHTLLGIGPMSENLIEAVFTLARNKDFPVMFIASRNQVDADEFGRGYVCNWNQEDFKADIDAIAKRVGFEGLYYLCRDHGGPWQRDEERNARLPVDKAMDLGKRSFVHDLKAGFDLLHVDPTKMPVEGGGPVPMELVLDMTVELMEFCETERKRLGLPEVSYEVGTEETDGGITSIEKYEEFINTLTERLKGKGLPLPAFIVGNTGTLTRLIENVGKWDAEMSRTLAETAKKHGVGLKEHNGDYLSDCILAMHPAIGVTGTNVAPEFGVAESRTMLMLAEVERCLSENGIIQGASNFKSVFTLAAIDSRRWTKWMTGDEKNYSAEKIIEDEKLSRLIVEIGGHYMFNDANVKAAAHTMFENLEHAGLNPRKIVINALMSSVGRYVDAFNMEGLTSEIMKSWL